MTRSLLSSSRHPGRDCPDRSTTLVEELRSGAAAILLPEEAVAAAHNTSLRDILAAQPPWSDLPVLVLTRTGADSADSSEAVRTLGNVTLLERPVRVGDAAQRGPHRASCARAPVPDSRAPRGPGARRGIAASRRSAQGRVPRHARPRAAQSAGAAADGSAAAANWPASKTPWPCGSRPSWSARSATSCGSWTTCSKCRASRAASSTSSANRSISRPSCGRPSTRAARCWTPRDTS